MVGQEHVASTVAVEIRDVLNEMNRPRGSRDLTQPAGRITPRIVWKPAPRGVPDRFARRAVAADERLAGPLHQVGLAGSQLHRDGQPSERHRLFGRLPLHPHERPGLTAQQAAFIERDIVSDRLTPIDGQAEGPSEPAHRDGPNPVIAVRERDRCFLDEVDRLTDRFLA